MAGKGKKADSVITRKQNPKEKEDGKKIPLTGKGVTKKAAPKVGLVAKKRSGGEAKKDSLSKAKKDTPQKTKGKKDAVRCKVIVKGGPKKKKEEEEPTTSNAVKKRKNTEDEPSTSKTVKRGKKEDGSSPKKTKKCADEDASEVKEGKKKGKKTKEEEDDGEEQKAKKPTKKSSPPPPRVLTAAQERLIAEIEEEERKAEKLKEEVEEKNGRVKQMQKEEKAAKKEKAALVKADKEMKAKLKALDRQLEQDSIDLRRCHNLLIYQQEMIDMLDRRIVQLQAIQDQRNIQSAHRGREALTHRVLNRQLKRYLAALRTSIIRMADGRSTPFIDRLLEIAQEDYSPVEEHRRIRDMMRSIGGGVPAMGRRVMQVDLTDL